jgi:hypothetical protein
VARDYYEEAECICEQLERSGRSDLADEIRDTMEQGSTATEILMALRWKLDQALAAESGLGLAEARMRSLKQGLDDVLK